MEQPQRRPALFDEGMPFRATKMWNQLVRDFRSGVRLKRKRWRMKYYNECFSGSEALAWIHEYLKGNPNYGPSVSRTQAQQLCQKFLQRNVFEHVHQNYQSTRSVFDDSHLYRFVSKHISKNENNTSACEEKENIKDCMASNVQVDIPSSEIPEASLKQGRHISRNMQHSRRPLGERSALKNMANGAQISNEKLSRKVLNPQKKQKLDGKNNMVIYKNSNAKLANFGNVLLHCNNDTIVSDPSKKQKSDYDSNSLQNCCGKKYDKESAMKVNGFPACSTNAAKVDVVSETGNANKQFSTKIRSLTTVLTDDCLGSKSNQGDLNELWKQVCLQRLQYALKIDSLEVILDCDSLDWKNVMENVSSDSRQVKESVPKWIVSAMKYLIHWPNTKGSLGTETDYSGFENDIFKTITNHFQSMPESLVPPGFQEVLTKISGLATKCKLSAIRALQHMVLLLKKQSKQQLQLLLRFMIKLSKNHCLSLSDQLPTRELAIQAFAPCIFRGEKQPELTEVLAIRITSFIMDNYVEVFKVPDGLQFQVEQQVAFHRRSRDETVNCSENGLNGGDVVFCQRVTKQEYEEQKQFGTQRYLEELLDSIVNDERINERQRKKKLKQFQKTYPEIYFVRFPGDGLSLMSQQPVQDRLCQVMKPLGLIKGGR